MVVMYTAEEVRANSAALVRACQSGSSFVSAYICREVAPIITPLRPSSPRAECFWGYFQRVESTIRGITLLKQVTLFPLVLAGTRSLLEGLVDVVLLYHSVPPDAVERMGEWERSARLKAAEAAVTYAQSKGREADGLYLQMADFVQRESEAIREARARLWPDSKQTAKGRHPERWSDRNLLEDCRVADRLEPLMLEEFYETYYRRMNWSIHGSAFASMRGADVPSIELTYVQAHMKSSEFTLAAMDLILSGLGQKSKELGDRLEEVRSRWQDIVLQGAPISEHHA